MRPSYETGADRDKERGVAETLEQLWDCLFVKTPRFYAFDYTIIQKNTAVAFCEIKCRAKRYDTLMLSLHKWQSGIQLSRDTGLPFLVVVGVDGEIWWHEVSGKPHRIIVGGRKDRADPDDMEPCVLLPYDNFKRAA